MTHPRDLPQGPLQRCPARPGQQRFGIRRNAYNGPVVSGARQTSRPTPSLALLREHRDEILRLAEKRGVSNIRIFGSVARGDATPDSDIDLLVDFDARESGFDLVAFEMDLEALLGYRVEAGTGVHEVIRKRVEAQAVDL